MYVNVTVDFDEVLEELTKEEKQKLYDELCEEFYEEPEPENDDVWADVWACRVLKDEKEFLKYIDKIIMDQTGRIV